jgi:hypothetical protein
VVVCLEGTEDLCLLLLSGTDVVAFRIHYGEELPEIYTLRISSRGRAAIWIVVGYNGWFFVGNLLESWLIALSRTTS